MITNIAEKIKIEETFKKFSDKVMTITTGSYSRSDDGPCITKAIRGDTNWFIKRAVNGSWAGWYSGGTLAHEERVFG